MKVAIYARYSSDNQRDASIADQLRVCRAYAERQGWSICEGYTDHAVSGATLLRAGFQALMRDALNRRFDVVLAESLDRFSRDQEDTAGLFKRLTFAGVNIVTLAEGDMTHLHIGFKGTMNALFLKDLAEKTHRGLRGRVEDGKSAGGLCYGYRVVKALNAGTLTTGERKIDPEQAAVVERIFRDFVAGVSPKQVAKNLNREGIAGPFGGAWSQGTIRTAWESLVLLANGIEPTRTRAHGRVNREQLAEIDLHWHDLRHEAACRWLAKGLDLRAIQLLLGHADLKTTQRYLNVTDEELRKTMAEKLWNRGFRR